MEKELERANIEDLLEALDSYHQCTFNKIQNEGQIHALEAQLLFLNRAMLKILHDKEDLLHQQKKDRMALDKADGRYRKLSLETNALWSKYQKAENQIIKNIANLKAQTVAEKKRWQELKTNIDDIPKNPTEEVLRSVLEKIKIIVTSRS